MGEEIARAKVKLEVDASDVGPAVERIRVPDKTVKLKVQEETVSRALAESPGQRYSRESAERIYGQKFEPEGQAVWLRSKKEGFSTGGRSARRETPPVQWSGKTAWDLMTPEQRQLLLSQMSPEARATMGEMPGTSTRTKAEDLEVARSEMTRRRYDVRQETRQEAGIQLGETREARERRETLAVNKQQATAELVNRLSKEERKAVVTEWEQGGSVSRSRIKGALEHQVTGGKKGRRISPGMTGHNLRKATTTLEKFTETTATAASTLGQFQRGSNPLFIIGGLLRFLGSGVGLSSIAGLGTVAATYGAVRYAGARYKEAGEYETYLSRRQVGPHGPEMTPQAMLERGRFHKEGQFAELTSGYGTPNAEYARIRELKNIQRMMDPAWIDFKKSIVTFGETTKDTISWLGRQFKNTAAGLHELVTNKSAFEYGEEQKIQTEEQKRTLKEYNDRLLQLMSKSPMLNEQYRRGQVEEIQGVAGATVVTTAATPTQKEFINALEAFKDNVARVTGNYGSN